MRRVFLLLLVAVGLGLALRAVLVPDELERGRGAADPIRTAEDTGAAAPDVDLLPAGLDRAAGDRGSDGAREAASASADPAASGGYLAQPAEGVALRIVARETGAPVAHANVYVMPATFGYGERTRRERLGAARKGARYRANADGRATLPGSDDAFVVAAELDELWGWLEVARDAASVELSLDSYPSLVVRVSDGAGGWIAGMPVALRRRSDPPSDLLRANTDGVGRAAFPYAPEKMAESGARYGYSIALAIPLAEPVETILDPEALPREPVVLVAPPLGRLVVRVFGFDGEPLAMHGARVTAVARAADAPRHPEYGWMPFGANAASATVRDGAAEFPFVAPNQRYELTLGSIAARSSDTLEAFGPPQAGATRTVDFHPLTESVFVTFRLVDAAEAPVASRPLDVRLRVLETGTGGKSLLNTDPAGRLTYQLDARWEPGQTRVLDLTLRDGLRGVRVDLSHAFEPGTHDLGDVRLGAPPLAIAGVVRDERGEPVERVALSVEAQQESGRRTIWRPLGPATLRTDEAGAFELRGWYDGTPQLRVRVRSSGYEQKAPVEAQLGTADVLVTVVSRVTGSIEGRLLLDEDVPAVLAGELSLTARAEPDATTAYSAEIRSDGRFRFQSLPEAAYTIRARVAASGEDLARVDGVVPVPDGGDPDPRLDPFDLRGHVGVVKLNVTDAAGAPIAELQVRSRPSGARGRWTPKRTEGTRRVVLLATRRLDVELAAAGYRTLLLESIAGEQDVVMRAGYPVRFVLAGGVPGSLAKNDSILIHLRDLTRDGVDVFGGPKPVDERGELSYAATRTGTFQVNALLQRASDHGQSSAGLGTTEPDRIQIVDSPGEQVFVLTLDAKALEQALARLGD